MLDRAQLIDLVENRYFGNVSREDVAAVAACFTADAEVVIRHGDAPTRVMKAAPRAGEQDMREFWRHLNANYHASFDRFEHFIDVEAQRCAATFVVTLAPKPGSAYAARGTLTLLNCNFFWLENGRIARMIVYYANPDTGGPAVGKPTGYPQSP
jgi:ketosteroid isomerase-like protein